MLPLWLNSCRPSIHVALTGKTFAEERWLMRSVSAWSLTQSNTASEPATLIESLNALLSARPRSSKKWMPSPSHVSLILPDSVVRYETLPWTPGLMLADELRQFAIERFDMVNQPVREGWVVQADWENKDGNTLAYALPHKLLDGLHQVVNQHGLILNRALPLSALAHYGRFSIQRHNELRILHSGTSTSALLYLNGKLISHLTETVRGTALESVRRLISRLQMSALTPEFKLDKLALLGVDPISLKEITDANAPVQIRLLNPLHLGEWQ